MCDPPAAVSTMRFDRALLNCEHNASIASPVYLLDWHCRRLQDAYTYIHGHSESSKKVRTGVPDSPLNLHNEVCRAVTQWQAESGINDWKALRIRMSFDVHAASEIVITVADRLPLSRLFPKDFILESIIEVKVSTSFTVVLDNRRTEASEKTTFKTTDRVIYDNARRRAGIPNYSAPKEVLLYNERDEIMDGSITTPYFRRDGEWFTPSSMSGGIQSATRYMALERRFCKEAVVLKDSVCNGEVVWLSNAVKGFFCGIVHIETGSEE